MKPPELNPEPEESLPSRRSPEGPDPPVLTEVTPPNDSPLDLESVKKKMDMGRYKAVVSQSSTRLSMLSTLNTCIAILRCIEPCPETLISDKSSVHLLLLVNCVRWSLIKVGQSSQVTDLNYDTGSNVQEPIEMLGTNLIT